MTGTKETVVNLVSAYQATYSTILRKGSRTAANTSGRFSKTGLKDSDLRRDQTFTVDGKEKKTYYFVDVSSPMTVFM